jgi:hypothetical protein
MTKRFAELGPKSAGAKDVIRRMTGSTSNSAYYFTGNVGGTQSQYTRYKAIPTKLGERHYAMDRMFIAHNPAV